jgi:predicted LPLAT superfamily acyltransferase
MNAYRGTHRGTHWADLPEAGMMAGLWFLYGMHRIFGRGLYRVLIWPVSWYFAATRPVARRASIDYLRRVGELAPGAGGWTAWRAAARHLRVFADALLDKALAWTGGLNLDATRMQIDARFAAAVAAGRGGLIVVAHFGNLEVMRALADRVPGLRLHILVHTRHAERFNRMLERMNPGAADRLLQVTELSAATVAWLAQRVDAGDYIVIAADRVPTHGARTMEVPFLGAPAPLPIGPWVLAAALGCPVYWLACYKRAHARADDSNDADDANRVNNANDLDRDRHTLICELLRERVTLPRAARAEVLRQAGADFARRLEQACRDAPYAWFNFFPFWRERGAPEKRSGS